MKQTKMRKNVKERSLKSIAQAAVIGSVVAAYGDALPFINQMEFKEAGQVFLFSVGMGLASAVQNFLQNMMPSRRDSVEAED